MPLERSKVVRAVIVCTCKELKCDNGMIIRYDDLYTVTVLFMKVVLKTFPIASAPTEVTASHRSSINNNSFGNCSSLNLT